MKCVILCSASDDASINIRDRLIESFGFEETDNVLLGRRIYSRADGIILASIDSLHIYADEEVEGINADLIVVASRHVSEAGVKAMLAHPVGNWKEAQYGGRPRTIVRTSAYAIYAAVTKLKELLEDNMLLEGTQVGMEATHHGPYSKTPLLFVELGSSEKEWRDEKLAEIVAEACIAACKYDKLSSK
ncbi:MAG TPA: hypothetical protein EYP20_01190, partial [Aigarchaeota archaeon]|nr:hypothetical protein [Aigarchaeota archaeon]